ncbi:TonB-dependent receptor [Hydrocarboniphaga effusa]|uniref:TonB-dependent receptor n=2 Tax=Hydrocarboniphaga effusa TaxID=243629 RepID=UPI003BAAC5A7
MAGFAPSAAWAQLGAPDAGTDPVAVDAPAPEAAAPAEPAAEAASAPEASASKGNDLAVEEIIVTAQKRAQAAMETPLSLTALDSSALADRQVAALEDLATVSPGIRSGSQNGVNRLFIRGIGLSSFASGADPSSAFYADGVYVGRPGFQLTSFFDVDRLEVVRGPQGTLYGRNATGGAVNLITRSPTEEVSGYLDTTLGNYDLHQTQGALSGKLNSSGTLLGRVAFNTLNRGGYGEDIAQHHAVNDANSKSFRGTLEYKASENVNFKLIGEHHEENDNNYFTVSSGAYPGYTLAGTQGSSNPANGSIPAGIEVSNGQDAATALPGDTNIRRASAVTGLATIQLDDNLSLSSITGWRDTDRHNASNSDNTSAGLGNTYYNESAEQFSQELQLGYNDDRWDAVLGLYYYHEKLSNYVLVPFVQFGPDFEYIQSGTMKIDAYAAFGQATYSVRPDLRVTVGARYNSEKKDTEGYFRPPSNDPASNIPIDDGKTWKAFTPKFGVEYDIAEDTLTYASVTRGFKSGTFNVGQANPAIDPEKIWAYEVGFKSRLFDRRVELTGAAFYYDYTDLQVNKIIGLQTLTTNAAAAKNMGVELATTARLTRELTFDANITYLKTEFKDFCSVSPLTPNDPADAACVNEDGGGRDLSGNQLPGAPEWAGGAGLEYAFAVSAGGFVKARVDSVFTSRVHFSEFNDNALSQASFGKVNASVRYESEDEKWSIAVWGKNITDEQTYGNKTLGVGLWGYPIYSAIDPPATYGVTFGLRL